MNLRTRSIGGLVGIVLAIVVFFLVIQAASAIAEEPRIGEKLKSIVIPEANFEMVPLEFVIEFLQTRSEELDLASARKGVNIVYRVKGDDLVLVSLKGADISLGKALKQVADFLSLEMRVEHSAVVIAPPNPGASGKKTSGTAAKDPPAEGLRQKLEGATIPAIEFSNSPLTAAIELIQKRSVQLDPEKKGVKFSIAKLPPKKATDFGFPGDPPRFDLLLKNVSIGDALFHICEQTEMKYKLTSEGVILSPKAE